MTGLALAVGLALLVVYAALARELATHGLAEFGYAPLVLEGMPWSAGPGFTWEQLWEHVYRLALLGPALILLSFGVYRFLEPRVVHWPAARKIAVSAAIASTALVAVVMLCVLRGRALVDDELAYRMQAGFLLDGRLTGPDVGYFPADVFAIRARLGYSGKYLFGEPLVQMIGTLVDVPALLHLPIYALTLLAWYRTVRSSVDASVAAWSTTFLALSPMLVLTSATAESEITALACIVAAGLGVEWIRTGGRPRLGALLVGAALGFGLTVRPQSVAPAGLVIGLVACWVLVRRRRWVSLAILVGVSAGFLLAIGAYDHALSGSALTLPWFLQCNAEHYGFGHPIEFFGYEHTPLRALRNLAIVAIRFNGWWLGWPLSLGVLPLWWWLGRPSRGCALWGAVGLAIVLFEAGYWGPGVSDTGPIYHFELLLPASLVAANVVVTAMDRWPTATMATLLVHVAIGTGSFMIVQIARIDRMVTDIHADSDAALARIPGRALLVYETWPSEVRPVAWMSSAFPRRYRRDTDRVVTYPRQGARGVQALRARYADRACWYYHRNPVSAEAELLACDAAGDALRRRSTDDSDRGPLFIASTAYKRTDFNPWSLLHDEIQGGHKLKAMKWPCCWLDEDLDDLERSVPQDPRCTP